MPKEQTQTPAKKAAPKSEAKRQPHPHPLTYRPQDFADRLGVTRRYLYDLMKHPDPNRRLPAGFTIGRSRFWRADDVQSWLDRQAERAAA